MNLELCKELCMTVWRKLICLFLTYTEFMTVDI